jgi:asparagine synthase (glutamine-hydrolysing)
MCGIAGIVDFSSRTQNPDIVLDIAKKIRHRGPDGEGVAYFDEKGNHALFNSLEYDHDSNSIKSPKAALAHLRLSIIDLTERGSQPMPDATRKLWITFNG